MIGVLIVLGLLALTVAGAAYFPSIILWFEDKFGIFEDEDADR